MTTPAELDLSPEEFKRMAQQMFSTADDAMLEQLYPIVQSLRQMARFVSQIVIYEANYELCDTATVPEA